MDMLKHPIFKALLDQAQDAYDFCSGPLRLWIQCDENTFLDVVCCSGRSSASKELHWHALVRMEIYFFDFDSYLSESMFPEKINDHLDKVVH